jgi:uncharacterized protein
MDAPSGLCMGCYRTLDEIAAWSTLDDADKQQVWRLIDLRQTRSVFEEHPNPHGL